MEAASASIEFDDAGKGRCAVAGGYSPRERHSESQCPAYSTESDRQIRAEEYLARCALGSGSKVDTPHAQAEGDEPLRDRTAGSLGLCGPDEFDEPKFDPINRPRHYAGKKIEPIAVIEAWQLGFHLGNTLKYLARCEDKGSPIQDLRKGLWYLQREIDRREREERERGSGSA